MCLAHTPTSDPVAELTTVVPRSLSDGTDLKIITPAVAATAVATTAADTELVARASLRSLALRNMLIIWPLSLVKFRDE